MKPLRDVAILATQQSLEKCIEVCGDHVDGEILQIAIDSLEESLYPENYEGDE